MQKNIPINKKNEWDLLVRLIPFLERNEKAILHIISPFNSDTNQKLWGVIRFKQTNYLAETEELEQILNILEHKHHRFISFRPRKNQIYIKGSKEEIQIVDFQDDLPF